MHRSGLVAAATGSLIALTSAASAGYTIVQQTAAAPTYSTTLNFDEPGTPTGEVPANTWAGIGISEFISGAGLPVIGDFTGTFPWVGSGNSFFGNFGAFITFSNDVTEMSFQCWDPSGPPSPFGGGLGVFLLNNGTEVGSAFVTPAWGGVGKTWFNVTTSAGSVFDEIRMLGFGFDQGTYLDNMSWNAVPAPGGIAILGAALFGRSRRRR